MSSEQKALDASLKYDLQLNASYQKSLEVGLLKWMDELVKDYIGAPQDEDEEVLKEGIGWLTESDVASAEQWFQLPENIQAYMDFVIKKLLVIQEEDPRFGVFCKILRNLKIGNDEVFKARMETLNNAQVEQVESAISSNSSYVAMNNGARVSEQLSTPKKKRDSISLEAADDDKKEERKTTRIQIETVVPYGAEPYVGTPPAQRAIWQAEWRERQDRQDQVVDPPVYPTEVDSPTGSPLEFDSPPIIKNDVRTC